METPFSPSIVALLRAVRDSIASMTGRWKRMSTPCRVAIALSGGRDSMALLDAFALCSADLGIELAAVHVHHGLSANADRWAQFCETQCAHRGIPLVVHRARIERRGGQSLEATARAARYAALNTVDADAVALAHHADDQAETLLLQLLRGAGPHGLAAMPRHSSNTRPILLRPFLALPRAAIDAYAAARSLSWIEDESNANTGIKRNFIRHEIANRLGAAFPGYPATLVRAARHQADAALLLDELAALDAQGATHCNADTEATLDRARLIELAGATPHRARNLLRWFLRESGCSSPATARLAEMLDQLTGAATDARVRLVHDGREIGIHRGRIVVHTPPIASFSFLWLGESSLELPHGVLEFAKRIGEGLAREALDKSSVVVRNRAGGERIRLAANRRTQKLKGLMQQAGIPAWQRDSLPLVFCGVELAAVPGIGVDVEFQARAGAPGFAVAWHPRAQRLDLER